MVSPVRVDGLPRPGAAARDGVALTTLRQRKQRICPELSGRHSRCRLVVLASETGGRWSLETRGFLHTLARDRAKSEHHSYAGEWNRHGGCGGGPSFRAQLFELWLCLWWTLGEGLGLMVSPCHARSGGRAGFRGLRVMLFSFFV